MPAIDSNPLAWINGKLVPFADAAVPVWDLGVVAGASITEMARTFRHQPFRLSAHLHRLTDACQKIGFPLPFRREVLEDAARHVTEFNARQIAESADLGIVVFVTAGANATYLGDAVPAEGTTVVHTFPLPFGQWRNALTNGVRLRIPNVIQPPGECLPVELKSRNRLHWWTADREAAAIEPGSRALLLTAHNYVTETSTACFYAVRNGTIVTPSGNVLDSLSRRIVEELAVINGIPFERRNIDRLELREMDEAFLSSTPVCLLPVSRIDGHAVGTTFPGPVFQRLAAGWNQLAGIDIQAQILGTIP